MHAPTQRQSDQPPTVDAAMLRPARDRHSQHQPPRPENLWTLLRRAGRLLFITQAARGLCAALAIILAAALGAIVFDAVVGLSESWLVAVDIALIAVALTTIAAVGWRLGRRMFNPRYLARIIETREQVADSRFINAVDFAVATPRGASAALLAQSLQRADALAASVAPRRAIDARPLWRAAGLVAIIVAAALMIQLALPGVFAAVTRRLIEPGSNHPPFTLLRFKVALTPQKVYYGKPAMVTAQIDALRGAALPDRASVVYVDADGKRALGQPQPMLMAGDQTATDGPGASFMLPIDRAEQSRRFYIETPGGRSGLFTLEVHPVPLFEHLTVEYQFPPYTNWEPVTRALGAEGVRALQGTRAIITAGSNMPLGHGTLVFIPSDPSQPAAEIRMAPTVIDPRSVAGTLLIEHVGRFEIALFSGEGVASDQRRQGPVAVIPDAAPSIEIVDPATHVVVPEDYAVVVTLRASDDVGIDRVTLNRSVNGMGPWPADLSLQYERPSAFAGGYVFDLPALGARAGDVITYFATAYDNRPGAAQSADTPLHVIEVISTEEYMEYARTQYQMDQIVREFNALQERLQRLKQQRDEILAKLQPLRDKAAAGAELSSEDQQAMSELEDALRKFQQQTSQAAQEAQQRAQQPPLYEFEQAYTQMLQSLADDLNRQAHNASAAAQAMQEAREHPSAGTCSAMADAADNFRADAAPFDEQSQRERQQTSDDLERLRLADAMTAQAERVRQLILQQRDLADRMADLGDQPNLTPAQQLRAHRLADEQEQIRQDLEQAREQLQQAAQRAAEQLPRMSQQAQAICQAISEMGVPLDQLRAAESARAGQTPQAYQAAEQAAANLEKLLSQCDGQNMQQHAAEDLDGCLKLPKPGLRQGLRQMAQSRSIPGQG